MAKYSARLWVSRTKFVIGTFEADDTNPNTVVQFKYSDSIMGERVESTTISQLEAVGAVKAR